MSSLNLSLKDFTKIGNLVDSITPAGTVGTTITEIDNIQFGLTTEREIEVKQELLSKASKNAKQKAEAIADSLDVNIIGVITVSENNVYIQYGRYESALLSKSAEGSAPTPINPQQITTTANVLVEFEIA